MVWHFWRTRFSADEGVGRANNLFRVFERAFAKGPKGCIDPLVMLLQAGPISLGWTRDEVEDWFERLRPEVMHADQRETYARNPDVEPYLPRLEYAAFDALLNKASWRSPDSDRRNVITLAAGVDSDNQTLRLQRPDATLLFPWIDPFGVFPVDFQVRANGRPARPKRDAGVHG